MKTVSQINAAILAADFSHDDLRSLINAVKYKQDQMNRVASFMFRKGDQVKFKTKEGITVIGSIVKINRKTTEIRSGLTNWKVTSSLLQKA